MIEKVAEGSADRLLTVSNEINERSPKIDSLVSKLEAKVEVEKSIKAEQSGESKPETNGQNGKLATGDVEMVEDRSEVCTNGDRLEQVKRKVDPEGTEEPAKKLLKTGDSEPVKESKKFEKFNE